MKKMLWSALLFGFLLSLPFAVFGAQPSMTLGWTDNSNNEDGFNIERAAVTTGPFVNIQKTAANATAYVDSGLQQATQYCYRVNAFNTAGASAYAGPVCALTNAELTVAKTGTGSGTVTSTPGGINCGATCAAWFAGNSTVTLTAVAAANSQFTGWGGACSGTAACTVTMSAARNVTAAFAAITVPTPPGAMTIKAGVQ